MLFQRFAHASLMKTVASYAPEAILATLVAMPFLTQPAYAYVDPSVMTYAIQAFAGIAVALSAVLGVAFRRTRKKVFALLNIDENAHKTVEADVHRIADGIAVSCEEAHPCGHMAASQTSQRRRLGGNDLRWRARFGYALIASFALNFTLFVVAPFEIVSANATSLLFNLSDVAMPLVLFSLAVTIALALVVSAARGRGFSVALMLIVGTCVASYVQALFLNQGLPAADGNTVVWGNYKTIAAVSLGAWLLIVSIAIFAGHRRGSRCRVTGTAIALALVLVQGVGVASILITPLSGSSANPQHIDVTEDGLFDLSPKDNVVVFVLDTFDTTDIDRIQADHPEALDSFENFTLFENSTGAMIPTRYAVPFLLTGQVPQPDQSFDEYYADRYGRSRFISDIRDAGYSVGVYSDTFDMEFSRPSEQDFAADTINLHEIKANHINTVAAVSELAKCALYRDMPWVLKPWFWYYTDEINNATALAHADSSESVPYRMNDIAYAAKLRERGLSIAQSEDNAGERGAFRFIHLQGTHYPYVMDENALGVGMNESTLERQARGSIKIVSDYLSEMKRLGVYDSATVIVTADHGEWYLTPDELSRPTSPLMLVKPATQADAHEPLRLSDMPVSHMDFHATVIDAVGANSAPYGQTVFQINDPDRIRRYYMTTSDGKHDTGIKEMEITGHAEDFSTWSFTGHAWPIEPAQD